MLRGTSGLLSMAAHCCHLGEGDMPEVLQACLKGGKGLPLRVGVVVATGVLCR
jgi:hypothetical protein